jgi:hypothetical protein
MTLFLHLIVPVAALLAASILVPRWIEPHMPETLAGLVLNGALSAVALTLLSALYFAFAYLARSTAVLDLLNIAPAATLGHFLRLGLSSAILWAPVLVLALSTAPKRWKENQW